MSAYRLAILQTITTINRAALAEPKPITMPLRVQNSAEDEGLTQTTSLVDFGLAHE